jgi:hypothetical protein
MSLGPIEARVAPPGLVSSETAGPAVAPPKAVDPSGEPSPFAKLLHGLGNQIEGGENMMRTAVASARDRSPLELIMLQANVYRYSETIDLASRLVDHATSSVKTVIQGSGQ